MSLKNWPDKTWKRVLYVFMKGEKNGWSEFTIKEMAEAVKDENFDDAMGGNFGFLNFIDVTDGRSMWVRKVLHNLKESGFLKNRRDEEDRRYIQWSLTEMGRERTKKWWNKQVAVM